MICEPGLPKGYFRLPRHLAYLVECPFLDHLRETLDGGETLVMYRSRPTGEFCLGVCIDELGMIVQEFWHGPAPYGDAALVKFVQFWLSDNRKAMSLSVSGQSKLKERRWRKARMDGLREDRARLRSQNRRRNIHRRDDPLTKALVSGGPA